jgi:4-hydroxy-2-oxoheptanedioate aldolase
MVVVHIETIDAVDAVDEYLATGGIDVLFVGPTDLSHSLGHPGDIDHPEVVAAMDRVAEAVAGSDTVLGVFAGTAERVAEWKARGARYFATSPDGFLRRGMHDYLQQARNP